MKLTPTVTDSNAGGVTVAGNAVTSGSPSAAVALNVGSNEIEVAVTAEDGSTKTYTVTVTRQSGDATLSALAASSSGSADGTFDVADADAGLLGGHDRLRGDGGERGYAM